MQVAVAVATVGAAAFIGVRAHRSAAARERRETVVMASPSQSSSDDDHRHVHIVHVSSFGQLHNPRAHWTNWSAPSPNGGSVSASVSAPRTPIGASEPSDQLLQSRDASARAVKRTDSGRTVTKLRKSVLNKKRSTRTDALCTGVTGQRLCADGTGSDLHLVPAFSSTQRPDRDALARAFNEMTKHVGGAAVIHTYTRRFPRRLGVTCALMDLRSCSSTSCR